MYLVGVIPGPSKPSLEEINPFLGLLVDDLLEFWEPGVWYSRTAKSASRHLVRAALVPVICDVPGARQVSGLGAHSSKYFCSFCLLELEDIENFDTSTWPRRTLHDHRRNAERWRDAASAEERVAIFKESGARWSELLRLPYWDPIKFTVVDSMHNLYLGLIKNHCRRVWGMNWAVEDGDATAHPTKPPPPRPSPQTMDWGTHVLYYKSRSALSKCPKAVLWHLCEERDLRRAGTVKMLARELDKWVSHRVPSSVCDRSSPATPPSVRSRAIPRSPQRRATPSALLPRNAASLQRFNRATLLELCQAYSVPPQGIKRDIAERLVKRSSSEPGSPIIESQLPSLATSGVARQTETGPIHETNPPPLNHHVLGREAFAMISEVRESMQLPSWINPVPRGFGTTQHGKLSADQWHTACTTLLPVALVLLWGNETGRKLQMLENFMDLTTAVVLAGMWSISEAHIKLFETYLHKYLVGLKELYKETNIVPNHHLALHLPDFMRLFGPVHSWRSFVFERFNYVLQHMNTNLTFGEMESTFMKTSCRAANLRPLLRDTRIASALPEFLDVLRSISGDDERGMRLESVLRNASAPVIPDLVRSGSGGRSAMLSEASYAAFLLKLNLEADGPLYVDPTCTTKGEGQRYLPRDVREHGDIIINGMHYRTKDSSSRDSNIQYRSGSNRALCTGQILNIFTHRRKIASGDFIEETLLTVSKLQELTDEDARVDTFRKFPYVGGCLYYDGIVDEAVIIRPLDVQCHVARTPLRIPGITRACVHILPLDRVSILDFVSGRLIIISQLNKIHTSSKDGDAVNETSTAVNGI
ncbi:hypothetical protein GY45DRAFT_1262843 [Cubamyces sp. BRFM 1775]|nr:hypothetical protein GY45DRAFT_1262843 [Cubamyces sp. BRFM 1775]